MMSCVNISVISDDEALRKHHHSEKRTRSSHPSVVSGDTVTRNNQQTGGIDCTLPILLPLSNPPPQVDIYTCNYSRRKTRTDVVGRGKGGICSSLILPRLSALSPSKKTGTASFPGLVASDSKRDSASLRLFYGAMVYQKECSEFACFATSLMPPDMFVFKCVLFPLGDKITYIQRCTCPAGSQRRPGNRSVMDRFVFRALGKSVTEGDQEKDGNR